MLNIGRAGKNKYDPINSGTVWSCNGVQGKHICNDSLDKLGIKIEFRETAGRKFPWRTSVHDGQLPYFLVWPI